MTGRCALLALCVLATLAQARAPERAPLTVMSFNIRYGTANDGENRWARICTWARLVDRDGRAFWHFNVHLDHESQPSREKSGLLLRKRVDERAFPAEPAIITGDFNAGEQNPAVAAITAGGVFVDTFRVKYPDERVAGTFSGFDPAKVNGDKIDYVFAPAGAEVLSAAIVRTARGGCLPSDHFPVVAKISFR